MTATTYRPVSPKKPVAWHSSTNTKALYFSAKLHISGRGATLPSIENTPSVTIIFILPSDAFSCCSRSKFYLWKNYCNSQRLIFIPSIFLCWYRDFLALHKRIPSMIDAWFNSSENTASSGVRTASNIPAFASKHDAYKIVSSRPWNWEILLSNVWTKKRKSTVQYSDPPNLVKFLW